MIEGPVAFRDGHHAEIPLRIVGTEGRSMVLAVTIDTGFTEDLVLDPETIRALGLPPRYERDVLIAGEREIKVIVYDALVDFDGETFEAEVLEQDGPPLAGMGLLVGTHLSIHVATGGAVRIERA